MKRLMIALLAAATLCAGASAAEAQRWHDRGGYHHGYYGHRWAYRHHYRHGYWYYRHGHRYHGWR